MKLHRREKENFVKRIPRRARPVLFGAAIVLSLAAAPNSTYSPHDKAYYAPKQVVDFVRPGLVFKITGAQIASDGTITAHVLVTDPAGLPLDINGITTPGAISMSFIAATIPSGKTQYVAYTTRQSTATAANGGATVTQPSSDTGGKLTTNATGDYTYTFGTRAPSGFDVTATHTIGVYGSRNLTAFDLNTSYGSAEYNFVPNGSAVTTVRDVVRDPGCTRCHDIIAFHGGARVGTAMCVLCHTPQNSDPNTGIRSIFP